MGRRRAIKFVKASAVTVTVTLDTISTSEADDGERGVVGALIDLS